MSRHEKHCKFAECISGKDEIIQRLEIENRHLRSMYMNTDVNLALQVANLQERVLTLTTELASERKKSNKTIRKITNNVNNVTINIIPFGQEKRLDHNIVLPLLQTPSDSVPLYIKLKHMDNNFNLKMNNARSKTIKLMKVDESGAARWVSMDKKKTIADIAENNLDELREEYNAEDVQLWHDWYYSSKLDQFGFDNQPEWKRMLKKIENILNLQSSDITSDKGVS